MPQARLEGAGAQLAETFVGHFHGIVNRRTVKQQGRDKRLFFRGFEQIVEVVAAGPGVVLEFAEETVQELSGGEQQMLAIGRALMTNPGLLLLDEPMEGLAPIIVQELVGVIRELVEDAGLAVIVVEQHAKLALSLTRDAIVLERGRIVHRSSSAALAADPGALERLVAVA